MPLVTALYAGGTDLASDLIEWKGSGPFSHTSIVMPDGRLLDSRSDVIAGIPVGVQIRPARYIYDDPSYKSISLLHYDMTLEQYSDLWAFYYAQIGKGYDKTAIGGFITGRNWKDDDDWFCSEYHTAGSVKIKLFTHPLAAPANRIDPNEDFAIHSTVSDGEWVRGHNPFA